MLEKIMREDLKHRFNGFNDRSSIDLECSEELVWFSAVWETVHRHLHVLDT